MADNPAQFKHRKKSIDDFEENDVVKIIPAPHFHPGFDVDEAAVIGKVKSKNPRKGTLRVKMKIPGDDDDEKEIEKEIDPSAVYVYKRGGRRNRKTRRRRYPRRK